MRGQKKKLDSANSRDHISEAGAWPGPWPKATRIRRQSPFSVFSPRHQPRGTIVFETFWRFAAERQRIFFRRLSQTCPPLTQDPILQSYKFTNAYRASDRVSQYLIRNVIYQGEQTAREVFFRTILFKLFNRISTWQLLVARLGWPTTADFKVDLYDRVLTDALNRTQKIYSSAYIMPSAEIFGAHRKHSNHLFLLDQMVRDQLHQRIAEAPSFERVFHLLRGYPSIGNFLAFQFAIDLNYSEILNYSEMDFVVPGPGALSGIQKCFESVGDYSPDEIVRLVAETQSDQFQQRGICFPSLWGRPLQLVDCQNLFCEVDKYARIAHPEIAGKTDRHRIKQHFRPSLDPASVWYPPKWKLEQTISDHELNDLGT